MSLVSEGSTKSPWPGSKGFVVSAAGGATAFYTDADRKLVQLFPLAVPEQVVQPEEVFTVEGTSLRCNGGFASGIASMACVDYRNNSPLGSPGFSLGDGSIISGLVHPSTGQFQIEYRRPASRAKIGQAQPPKYTLKPGGRIRLAGSALACDARRPQAAINQIVCFATDGQGKPKNGGYGARFRSDGLLEAGVFDRFGALQVEFRRQHA